MTNVGDNKFDFSKPPPGYQVRSLVEQIPYATTRADYYALLSNNSAAGHGSTTTPDANYCYAQSGGANVQNYSLTVPKPPPTPAEPKPPLDLDPRLFALPPPPPPEPYPGNMAVTPSDYVYNPLYAAAYSLPPPPMGAGQYAQQGLFRPQHYPRPYLSGYPNSADFFRKRKPSQESEDAPKKSVRKRKKPLSQTTTTRHWTMEEASRAIEVEKEFTKRSNHSLIIKFPDPEINREIVSKFHDKIETVYFQQPCTPRFCFVTLVDNADKDEVINDLNRMKFGEGHLSAEMKKEKDEELNIRPDQIDPLTLYVGNLPQWVTVSDMEKTYPKRKRMDIGFAKKMKYTRYAFVLFHTVEDAIAAFQGTHSSEMYNKSLIVRFRRLHGPVGLPGEKNPQKLKDEEVAPGPSNTPDKIAAEISPSLLQDDLEKDKGWSTDASDDFEENLSLKRNLIDEESHVPQILPKIESDNEELFPSLKREPVHVKTEPPDPEGAYPYDVVDTRDVKPEILHDPTPIFEAALRPHSNMSVAIKEEPQQEKEVEWQQRKEEEDTWKSLSEEEIEKVSKKIASFSSNTWKDFALALGMPKHLLDKIKAAWRDRLDVLSEILRWHQSNCDTSLDRWRSELRKALAKVGADLTVSELVHCMFSPGKAKSHYPQDAMQKINDMLANEMSTCSKDFMKALHLSRDDEHRIRKRHSEGIEMAREALKRHQESCKSDLGPWRAKLQKVLFKLGRKDLSRRLDDVLTYMAVRTTVLGPFSLDIVTKIHDKIRNDMGGKWIKLALALGVSLNDIDKIEQVDHEIPNKVNEILRYHREFTGLDFSVWQSRLRRALEETGRGELSGHVENVLAFLPVRSASS